MTRTRGAPREDRTLEIPDLPRLDRTLGELPLARPVGLSDDPPFTVAGPRVFVLGTVRQGILEARAHPVRIVRRLGLAGSEPTEGGAASPLGFERRLRLAGRPLVERVIVPPAAPAFLVEWAGPEGTLLEIEWEFDPDPMAGPVRWRAADRGLALACGDEPRPAGGFLFVLSSPPRSLRVGDGIRPGGVDRPGLTVRAGIAIPATGSVRMAAVAPPPGASARVLRAVDRAVLAVRGRATALERAPGLVAETPDPGLNRALDRAIRQLPSYLADVPGVGRSVVEGFGPAPEDDEVRPGVDPAGQAPGSLPRGCVRFAGPSGVATALALLATGRGGAARDVVQFLGRHQHADGRVPRSCSMTGERAYDDDASTTLLYLLLVARYLAWTGDRATVRGEWGRVERAVARTLRDPSPPAGAGAVLGELRHAAVDIGHPPPDGHPASKPAEGDDASGAAYRWPEPEPISPDRSCPDRALDAARPVGWLVYQVLGASPDAPRGRLVLRPRVPDGWATLTVRRLPVGDAAVTVEYRRDGGEHRFAVRQERGGAPLRLVLEPTLPGARVAGARVDGEEAELGSSREGDHFRVPVQLALDHPRMVVVEMTDGD